MTYQTLYRKYRSKTLTDLVGQPHVIQTVKNALIMDRLSHAYIFSGPRGTGKTSTARILAKMVNATNDNFEDCDICQKISLGSCVDVIEIDAASNTGVDHMRQLTEQVQFLPVEAKCKVFIIDEVHMLSTGAFNALLKTLEEPPKNILFILATTELHKIPATIQSRAQTLSFRPIQSQDISDHVQYVCDQEKVTIDDAALAKLVQHAKGGMRDALSLLDQLISVSDDQHVKVSDIDMVLGTVQGDELSEFLMACFTADIDTAVSKLRSFLDSGVNVFQLYDDILHYLKHELFDSKNKSFSVDEQLMASWLLWFSEQIASLKLAPYPELVAQVKLFSYLKGTSSVGMVSDSNSVSLPHQTKPKVTIESPPLTQAKVPSPPVTTAPPSAPSTSKAKPVIDANRDVEQHNVSAPKLTTSDQVWSKILQLVDQEYKMLMPILSGSSIIDRNGTLYIVIEQTYTFFEKKLAEKKYVDWFLNHYNQFANKNISDLVVTSNVNDIYKDDECKKPSGNDDNNSEQASIQSKTVNQIIELFDGNI